MYGHSPIGMDLSNLRLVPRVAPLSMNELARGEGRRGGHGRPRRLDGVPATKGDADKDSADDRGDDDERGDTAPG